MTPTDARPRPGLVDAHGRPLAGARASGSCPRCGRSPDARVRSSGFGREPYPICVCGYEFVDEVWVERG